MARKGKPKLAIYRLASCGGCQLSLLDCEDELLYVSQVVEIASFPEATSTTLEPPYDISLVEGSVTTPHDAERIQHIRHCSRIIVALGACATTGGIQALRNLKDIEDLISMVYPRPAFIHTLDASSPLSSHIEVDFELRGCPINKHHLIELLSALLQGRNPTIPTHSLCLECKQRGNVCLMVAEALPCLGPITQAGCGAICPTYGRGCYGCFGSKETPNYQAMCLLWSRLGVSQQAITQALQAYHAPNKDIPIKGLHR